MIDPATALANVRGLIAKAARTARRQSEEVTLIAVSKTQPPERIIGLIAAGQRVFGENRVREAAAKWPALREAHGEIAVHLEDDVGAARSDGDVADVELNTTELVTHTFLIVI